MFLQEPRESDLVQDIKLESDGSNAELFYFPSDPITAKSCSRNYAGFIRNDIQLVVEQADQVVAAELLQRLVERKSDGVSEQTMSDQELLGYYKSKYCQTDSEMINYFDGLLEKQMEREQEIKFKIEEDKEASEKKSIKEHLWNSMTAAEKDVYLARKREKEIEEGLKED